MPPAVAYLANRLPFAAVAARFGRWPIGILLALHGAALALMAATEADLQSGLVFLLTWGLLSFTWRLLLRRPAAAAALSLAMIVVLILLSQFKHGILFMTVNFVDLMIIDTDTFAFLVTIYPGLGRIVAMAVALAALILAFVWWVDPLRVRRGSALAGGLICVLGLAGLSWSSPSDPYNEFYRGEYVSKFARSGIVAVEEYLTRGLFDADANLAERLKPALDSCRPGGKPPHIVMVFDESSFDISTVQGLKLPADYRAHFASFDDRTRSLVVEGVSGPSWFTEYNVLNGLSVRSYGRFADFVTRIAAGRVERGLPRALARCGYKTISHYPFHGAFLSARQFQASAGIEKFLDARDLGSHTVEPDGFYYDAAVRTIERERGERPLFLLVYTLANHFPWDVRYRPELTPGWRDLGNGLETDEYLRRQTMSARDYAAFKADLARKYPSELFLIVRFGDHQPSFARPLLDPALDDSFIARQIAQQNPRFLTTYYAIDAVNFRPVETASARDVLDAPYLPLVVLEAAGVPLDPSFAEQKAILERCRGLFYRCASGAEARRFNRLLIDAGLIKGL
jgi:hypothetical protein